MNRNGEWTNKSQFSWKCAKTFEKYRLIQNSNKNFRYRYRKKDNITSGLVEVIFEIIQQQSYTFCSVTTNMSINLYQECKKVTTFQNQCACFVKLTE